MEFSKNLLFDHELIEAQVEASPEFYQGLPMEALYTSPVDLEEIFSHPMVAGTWVDLGAGVGNTILHYSLKFPHRRALGVEHSLARAEAGQKKIKDLGILNAELLHGDLLRIPLPVGETYFLYFPTGHVLDRMLYELSLRPASFRVVVIESHGDLIERLEQESWLTKRAEIPLSSQRHHPFAVVYEAKSVTRVPDLCRDFSFQEKIFFIRDKNGTWLGESFGMMAHAPGFYNLATPPRTIAKEQVEMTISLSELDAHAQFAVRLRRLGELTFTVSGKVFVGSIRKIFVRPGFSLELSSGETIEWDQLTAIQQGSYLCYESSP